MLQLKTYLCIFLTTSLIHNPGCTITRLSPIFNESGDPSFRVSDVGDWYRFGAQLGASVAIFNVSYSF